MIRTRELRDKSGAPQQRMAGTEERPKKRSNNGEAQAKKKRRIETAGAGKAAEEPEHSKRLDHSEIPGQQRAVQPEEEKQLETNQLPETPK